MKKLYFFILMLTSHSLFAKSLKATADKLSSEVTVIAFAVSIFAGVIVALAFMFGKQDAANKAAQYFCGLALLVTAGSIISFFKGIA